MTYCQVSVWQRLPGGRGVTSSVESIVVRLSDQHRSGGVRVGQRVVGAGG